MTDSSLVSHEDIEEGFYYLFIESDDSIREININNKSNQSINNYYCSNNNEIISVDYISFLNDNNILNYYKVILKVIFMILMENIIIILILMEKKYFHQILKY